MNEKEKPAQRIERLMKEIEESRHEIGSCHHQFSAPTHATREYKEPVFSHFEPHGSDPEPIYDYVPRTEHGWKRECTRCGYSEYTAKTKPIVTGHEPDFGTGGSR
jgi:hypothetical protein